MGQLCAASGEHELTGFRQLAMSSAWVEAKGQRSPSWPPNWGLMSHVPSVHSWMLCYPADKCLFWLFSQNWFLCFKPRILTNMLLNMLCHQLLFSRVPRCCKASGWYYFRISAQSGEPSVLYFQVPLQVTQLSQFLQRHTGNVPYLVSPLPNPLDDLQARLSREMVLYPILFPSPHSPPPLWDFNSRLHSQSSGSISSKSNASFEIQREISSLLSTRLLELSSKVRI